MSTELPPLIPPPIPTTIGIHGNASYVNFEFSFFTLPMLLLLLPILYIPITVIIILRILVKLLYAIKEKTINAHLFFAITFSQFMCLLFFLLDVIHLRLPATGIFTSWCASVEPNRFLNVLYAFTFYVNYATMLFPFLVSVMRHILIVCPQNHKKVNGTLLRFAIPAILIYPSFFTFFMIPSLGYCFQPGLPYQFGQIQIMFRGTWFGLRNNYFLLGNTMFWMAACLINNSVLLVKLIRLKISLSTHVRSQKSFKAEVSLTFTTFSMIFSYATNAMIVISFLFFPGYTYAAIMMRPFGNDLETCVVPWVFYLTHPVFRRKNNSANIVIFRRDKLHS